MLGGLKMFTSLASQGVFHFDGEWRDRILESFPGPFWTHRQVSFMAVRNVAACSSMQGSRPSPK